MEQSLAGRGDGEELIDTKVEGVHSTDEDLWPYQYAYSMWYGHMATDYLVKF